jgi:hypothetical protein
MALLADQDMKEIIEATKPKPCDLLSIKLPFLEKEIFPIIKQHLKENHPHILSDDNTTQKFLTTNFYIPLQEAYRKFHLLNRQSFMPDTQSLEDKYQNPKRPYADLISQRVKDHFSKVRRALPLTPTTAPSQTEKGLLRTPSQTGKSLHRTPSKTEKDLRRTPSKTQKEGPEDTASKRPRIRVK